MVSISQVSDPIVHAQLIRISLQNLGESNGHHVFESICSEVARARIAANFRCATGPVSAGGDQGRDGETYWTDLPDGSTVSPTLARISHAPIVMACTIQKNGIPTKIRRDIVSICSRGARVEQIVYFLSYSLAENKLHELQHWARTTFDVGLSVWDGQQIARTLSDPDLWFVAERYLHLSFRHSGSPPDRPSVGRERMTKIWFTLAGFVLAAVLAAIAVWNAIAGDSLTKRLTYRDWSVQVVADRCRPDWKRGDQVARSVVDLDGRLMRAVPGSRDVPASGADRDLVYYLDCPANIPSIKLYAGLAILVNSDPTWRQCGSAVPRNGAMVVTPRAGLTICARTEEDAVVLIRVRQMAADGTSATLVVTLWR